MTGRDAPTASTRVVGVIGDPVRHSLSPTLHNAAIAALGLDWVYVAFEVAPGFVEDALRGMKALGIEGLSVTMPHKTDTARLITDASDDVRALDAANTVVRCGDSLRAEITDGDGCLDALRENGVDVNGLRCCIVGAGGAGRAVTLALSRAGAREIVIVNRDSGRAEKAVTLAGGVGRIGVIQDVRDAELIINATPVGMGADDGSLIDRGLLSAGQIVNDLIYHPVSSPLVVAARSVGATAIGGLDMLVHQAARQVRLWTGEPAPIEAMRAAVRKELALRFG